MKLDYKIIWVEDKIETKQFQDLKKNVAIYLEEQFFNVIIETAEDYDEFKEKFKTHDVFDLIITDLNLNESHGSQVIDFVRDEKHIYTEIFFYSANGDFKNTHLVNNNRITFYQLDGQDYHKELNSSILELIKLTILKFQNIITMRGMIIQETSSLDVSMSDLATRVLKSDLNNFIKKNPEINFEKIITGFFDSIQKNAKEKCTKVFSNKLKEVIKDDVVFNTGEKINIIGLFIDELNEKGFQLDKFTDDYKLSINKVRNNFAHAVLEIDPNTGREFFKKGDFTFNEESCKEIRKNIIKHKENLDNLQVLLSND